MFTLTDNRFLSDGVCRYTDEYGNTVFMRRDGKKFAARLRFKDERVQADILHYDPDAVGEEDGGYINITCSNGASRKSEDVSMGIQGFTMIVQRWIGLLSVVSFMETDNRILGGIYGKTPEEVAREKASKLMQYEELAPIGEFLFAKAK